MIISGKQVPGILKAYEQNRVTKPVKSEKGEAVSKRDAVELSAAAQDFGQILQSLKKIPEVRDNVVKEFSDRINSGSYIVDSRAVAEKMLDQTLPDRLR